MQGSWMSWVVDGHVITGVASTCEWMVGLVSEVNVGSLCKYGPRVFRGSSSDESLT